MDNYQLINQDTAVWYELCNCCPYGYHIDLDFVHYCNSLEHIDYTASMKRRKDRRRQRRSMVVLLGLDVLLSNRTCLEDRNVIEHPLESIQQNSHMHKSQVVNDDLQDAVMDFEQTLKISKMSNNHSSNSDMYDSFQSSRPSTSPMPRLEIISANVSKTVRRMDQDLTSPTYGLIPADLHNIREQMALSLERTKIVEDLVKHIPLLQAQVAELKEEKRQLLLQVKLNQTEHSYNGQLQPTLNTYQKIVQPHRRDFGVMCSISSPIEGMKGHHMKTFTKDIVSHMDEWYKEKSNFLNDKTLNNSHCNDLKVSMVPNIVIVTKETQTTLPRDKKNAGIQTIHNFEMSNLNTIPEDKKLFRSVGISALVHTTDASTIPIVFDSKTRVLGVSNDIVDKKLCIQCTCRSVASKSTSTSHTHSNLQLQKRTIGCQYDVIGKHVTVQCDTLENQNDVPNNVDATTNTDIETLQKTHSVSCQYEHVGLHKMCQVDFKLKDKAVQYDLPIINKITTELCSSCNRSTNELSTSTDLNNPLSKISLSSLTVSRSKSFCSFDSSTRHSIGCQYEPFNSNKSTQINPSIKNEASQYEDASYFTKFKTTLISKIIPNEQGAHSNHESESIYKEDVAIPSRIPRLQFMPENRVLMRQDTYSVDLSKKISTLTDEVCESASLHEVLAVPEKLHYNMNLSSDLPSYPDIPLERTKVIPSKSMRAALKVLSDCLKKGQTENLEDQLKNSINIVQLEWFKISSLIDANPLDVEDYLDFFEDTSFDLLRYIVNMIDANGNTAMHYAVSHGNFDVVSILLDSKVCDVNQPNKVGYTSVMLVSLVEIHSPEHANVVQRLFKLTDVNVKAKQHGQTALMLAVSHGRLDMVQMLLKAGADINIQDEDGSTALMCAAEHGHIGIVKLFLGQPECDSTISDMDGSTALTIAMEAGHRPIGVLLYTHQRIRRPSIQHSKSS